MIVIMMIMMNSVGHDDDDGGDNDVGFCAFMFSGCAQARWPRRKK